MSMYDPDPSMWFLILMPFILFLVFVFLAGYGLAQLIG